MNDIELEIYGILNKIDKLNSTIYNKLIKDYKEDLVNKVIDKMIEMDSNNILKFEYYIYKVQWVDEKIIKSLFEAYMIDLKSIDVLTVDENKRITMEINEIVVKLREMLNISDKVWISDTIDNYLKESNDDLEKRKEIEKLYNKFIYKRNLLVEGNLKFVIFVAKKYCINNVDICDIIQMGNIGMMRACEKYDPSYDTCFTTYSYHWIKQFILKNLNNITMSFEVPYHLVSFNISMRKIISDLRAEFRREPMVHEIAERMKETEDKIRTCLVLFSEHCSLDEPIRKTEEGTFTRLDALEDEGADLFNLALLNDMSDNFKKFLESNLKEREMFVLCHRYELFGYEYKKLQELGNILGITRERVRQLENKAIKKIRKKGKCLAKYVD